LSFTGWCRHSRCGRACRGFHIFLGWRCLRWWLLFSSGLLRFSVGFLDLFCFHCWLLLLFDLCSLSFCIILKSSFLLILDNRLLSLLFLDSGRRLTWRNCYFTLLSWCQILRLSLSRRIGSWCWQLGLGSQVLFQIRRSLNFLVWRWLLLGGCWLLFYRLYGGIRDLCRLWLLSCVRLRLLLGLLYRLDIDHRGLSCLRCRFWLLSRLALLLWRLTSNRLNFWFLRTLSGSRIHTWSFLQVGSRFVGSI
jgi:hypothetical protein